MICIENDRVAKVFQRFICGIEGVEWKINLFPEELCRCCEMRIEQFNSDVTAKLHIWYNLPLAKIDQDRKIYIRLGMIE